MSAFVWKEGFGVRVACMCRRDMVGGLGGGGGKGPAHRVEW